MDDVPEETKETEPAAEPLTPPPLEQGAIRGAFLARATVGAESTAGGGIQSDDAGAASLKSAFIRHLTEPRSGAVVGDETSGDAVVRSIYAARTTPSAVPERRRAAPKRKAAPTKKGRARAAAKPAAAAKRGRPAKQAAKRRANTAAAPRRKAKAPVKAKAKAKARRPVAAARKRGRKTRR